MGEIGLDIGTNLPQVPRKMLSKHDPYKFVPLDKSLFSFK